MSDCIMGVKLENKRYILIQLSSFSFDNLNSGIIFPSKSKFTKDLRKNFIYLFGNLFISASFLHVVDTYSIDQSEFFIVRCYQKYRDYVEASITLLHYENIHVEIERVFGQLSKIKKYLKETHAHNLNIEEEEKE